MNQCEKWAVIILAAGYGSRLSRDINNDDSKEFFHLRNLPKPLLPVADVPLLDYWYSILKSCKKYTFDNSNIFLVTNHKYYDLFHAWCQSRGLHSENIVNDGKMTNETRLGAALDISLCISTFSSVFDDHNVLIIAGDTLFCEDFNLESFLDSIEVGNSGVVYYPVSDEEVSKRGIIEVDENGMILSLLEKPNLCSTTSRNACPAFYAYSRSSIPLIHRFVEETSHLPIEMRDAPGNLLSWLLKDGKISIHAFPIQGRFDIGNLQDYRNTLTYFAERRRELVCTLPNFVQEKCFPRVGLMGNPSDGFNGKTVSFLFDNFSSFVNIRAIDSNSIRFIPNPEHDRFEFSSFEALQQYCSIKGYYGGLRLLQATCKTFSTLCFNAGVYRQLQRGFEISYDTDIPRMVGLSGSSAIVVATFRALLTFYGLTISDLKLVDEEMPQIILNIEKQELGISAGLQDRVIQWYGGLVAMDFAASYGAFGGKYQPILPTLLPPLYLAYNTALGGDSGKVHSTVRSRWEAQDKELLEGMKELGMYATECQTILQSASPNFSQLAQLMDCNFAMRRRLYGDDVVGCSNIAVHAIANKMGMGAKFTGSGGAFVCLRYEAPFKLSAQDFDIIRFEFLKHGFEFCEIHIPT